jgi:HlyD family secretion protein
MSCAVDIKTRKALNVIKVPIQSVTTKVKAEDGNKKKLQPIVFVLNGTNKISALEVTTGIQDDEFIEIKSGLEEKQKVVDAPYSAISKLLKDGMTVKVVKREELFQESESK